ncbi:NAD(P)-binding protein [Pelagibacteraceae bacterium]|jgi:renalase|nr:NAD(P)-binding protein [Pelagibacteraceae bacterium]MDC0511497.1 NAD(P)-binding protein [Pelagibacteraceae bacterium]
MIDFCVLGSGVAGSTIANLLSKKYSVQVFDKARGAGGRSSNKKLKGNLSFDHGVQYVSPKSKVFTKIIQKLYKKKILKTWDGNHLDFTFEKKKLTPKYIGLKANNALCKYYLKNIRTSFSSQIVKIVHKKYFWEIALEDNSKHQFKSLILTCPFPQLKKLAGRYLEKKISNLKIKMQPNITVMIALSNKKELPISSVKFDDNILSWAANENSKKRFKSNLNLWTLQASLKWSKKTINKYKTDKSIMNKLISRFTQLTGFEKNKITHKNIHGWKYSYNYQKTSLSSNWNKKYQLGICGDWFGGPKVENAWLSAIDLAKKIK